MNVPEISVTDLAEQLDRGARLFDVRQPDEFEAVRAQSAELVPLDTVPERIDAFPAEQRYYVICRSGVRSGRAVEYLRGQGHDAVNVAGGTNAWVEAELPTATGA